MEYVVMRELGQSDAIERNYNLADLNGSKSGVVLDRAFARMGFDQKNTARPFVLPMIRAKMRDMGYAAGSDDALSVMVREWYNWDRIRRGDIRTWSLKPRSDISLI